MAIKENYVVEKRNVLNEIRANDMTLQELRFFAIYLAKINPRDESTRFVRFSMLDFKNIMELGTLNMRSFKDTIKSLLQKVVDIPLEKKGNFVAFQLFKKCKLIQDENEEWFVEIDAHDDALPLMFDYKEKYFSYNLWNALGLKSTNQLRMYEILKQYEKIGRYTISLKELKELLGIREEEYSRWSNFRIKVLDACKRSLTENTDISFEYEAIPRKTGRGRKIDKIKFKIIRNTKFKDPLSLAEFIKLNAVPPTFEAEEEYEDVKSTISLLSGACKDEFTDNQIKLLCEYIFNIVQVKVSYQSLELERYHYLSRKYAELEWRSNQTDIKNRFGYLKKIISADL